MPDQEPQPHPSELASFGEELRREREIRGISLKEIADATKISKRFLEAIERNDHKQLPAPAFTRGFVRDYARYLGLNDELRRGYHRTLEAKDAFHFSTIGNAGGISLTLNDVPVPPLGRDGQVLHDVVFDRAALQKLQTPNPLQ